MYIYIIFIHKNYLNIDEQINNNQTCEIGDDDDIRDPLPFSICCLIFRLVISGTNKRRKRCLKEFLESE